MLDEIVEVIETWENAPEPHQAGDMIEARAGVAYRIVRALPGMFRVRLYEAMTGQEEPIWLHEAFSSEGAVELRRAAAIGDGWECPMFPRILTGFDAGGRTYLATEPAAGSSLADEMESGQLKLPQVLSILSQIAFALARLHDRGWIHGGLRPSVVQLGKPLKITDFSDATRLGEVPGRPYYHAGYSPPELLEGGPADARVDVYAVGALLYQAVNGRPIAETGIELMTWQPPVPIAGIPQILQKCLGEPRTRYARMDALHQDLLRLVRRSASATYHTIAAATSIGLEPSRTTNQDAFGQLSGRFISEEMDQVWSVVCVADGMGGMEAGEVASEAAVEAVFAQAAAALAKRPGITPANQAAEVRRWVDAANEHVCSAMEERRARGGCTLACAGLIGKRLAIAHVGDCRIYLVRREEIRLLTRDHSIPMALVQQGEIPIEAVRSHPDRSCVLRSLGNRRPMPDYLIDGLEQTTGAAVMDLQTGDVLILCSDGVWEPLDEETMLGLIRSHPANLQAVADAFMAATLRQGAPDNATVVLLRVDEGLGCEEVRTCST